MRVQTSAGDFAADALIGADGIHSAVRAQLHPEPDPLLWSGVRMFRGAVEREPFLDGRTMAIVKGGDGVDLVMYPIGGGQINWVVMLPESDPGPLPGDAKWNQPGDRAEVLRASRDAGISAGWTPPIWCAAPSQCWSIRWSTATCCRGGAADG